jgi:hypothetical protein
MRCITFTTDFGTRDWFVGMMKGVVLCLAPRARIVDFTHEIAPGDIRAGAFALAAGYSFFPRHTIHVAVVDPGVGTKRRAIAVQTADYLFVGPDNGLLSWALAREKIKAIHALENRSYFLPRVSCTFHGRDIFAPVAAHLSNGVPLRKLGPGCRDLVRLPWPKPTRSSKGIRGEVVYVDRFGNAITNISSEVLSSLKGRPAVFMGRKRMCAVAPTYQTVARGRLVAVIGYSGFLEIAVNGASAAERLGVRLGTKIGVE